MSTRTLIPDARLTPDGLVSIQEGIPLPNYTGLVLADFNGRRYVMWAFPPAADGGRDWAIINAGSAVVQSELDKFLKEHASGRQGESHKTA